MEQKKLSATVRMRMVKVPVQKEPEKNSLIVEGGAGMGLASCDPAGMFAVRTHDPIHLAKCSSSSDQSE